MHVFMRAYLGGAIEYSPDRGRRWRSELTSVLRELGHEWYDPAQDERKNLDEEEVMDFRKWKTSDFPRFQRAIRKIIQYDLDQIEHHTDYIICFWDEHAGKGAGTQGELTFAFRRKVPVYLVLGMERDKVSGWLLGCATEVFEDFDSLKKFLRANYAAQLAEQR
jgi:hypothetical protein